MFWPAQQLPAVLFISGIRAGIVGRESKVFTRIDTESRLKAFGFSFVEIVIMVNIFFARLNHPTRFVMKNFNMKKNFKNHPKKFYNLLQMDMIM
jgi:hypothetical protein